MRYRPWGPLDWVLSLSTSKNWYFVGTIGTEERSLTSWFEMRRLGLLSGELITQIQDEDSEKYRERTAEAIRSRRVEFHRNGGNLEKVEIIEIMAELFRISALARRAAAGGQSVVLDITSFPKRFFSPFFARFSIV